MKQLDAIIANGSYVLCTLKLLDSLPPLTTFTNAMGWHNKLHKLVSLWSYFGRVSKINLKVTKEGSNR